MSIGGAPHLPGARAFVGRAAGSPRASPPPGGRGSDCPGVLLPITSAGPMAPTRRILLALFLLSGSLRLILLSAWARGLAIDLGPGPLTTGVILAAILSSMAAGSVLIGRYADHSGRHPLAVHGLIEIGIGLYAILSLALAFIPGAAIAAAGGLASLPGAVAWPLRFLAALAVVGLPSAMMGGSLPSLARITTVKAGDAGWTVGSLLGAGLIGTALGAAVAFFELFEAAGYRGALIVAATGSVALGLFALEIVRRWWEEGMPVPGPVSAAVEITSAFREGPAGLMACAGLAGLAAAIYLGGWFRVFGLVLGHSVYVTAMLLVVVAAGLALGTLIGARIADRLAEAEGYAIAAAITAGTALAGHATFIQIPQLPVTFALAFHGFGLAGVVTAGSPGWAARLFGLELVVIVAGILPACIFAGTLFPLLVRLRVRVVEGLGSRIGSIQGALLGGFAAGAALAPMAVVPSLGIEKGILAGLTAFIVPGVVAVWAATGWSRAWRIVATAGALGTAALLTRGAPVWDPFVLNSGVHTYATDWLPLDLHNRLFGEILRRNEALLFHKEGATAGVIVSRNVADGITWMAVDGSIEADSHADLATEMLLGHLPMLMGRRVPSPDRGSGAGPSVAVIGYGNGVTAGAVSLHAPGSLVVVDREPAIIEGAAWFDEWNHAPLGTHGARGLISGGRAWLKASGPSFDVIILSGGGSWIGPAASLATREALMAGRARLLPGGLLCQRLPIDGMDPALVRTAFRTFATLFPAVKAYMTAPWRDIILLGSDRPFPADPARLEEALQDPRVAENLGRAGIRAIEDLLTHHLMNDPEARAFAGEGAIATDDNGLYDFEAPLTIHTATPEAHERALQPFLGDPLAGIAGRPGSAEEQARAYARLAMAFFGEGRMHRAYAMMARAQELHPTQEGDELLVAWESRIPGRERR